MSSTIVGTSSGRAARSVQVLSFVMRRQDYARCRQRSRGPNLDRVPQEQSHLAPFRGLLTRRLEAARLKAAAPFLDPDTPTLDIGIGLTDLPGWLRNYVGCDRNPILLEENRRRFPRAIFHEWDVAEKEPPTELRDRRFDVILMLAVLEHLSEPARVLKRVAMLLTRGGKIVTTTPHPVGHAPLEIGARLGLLSAHADEEHEALLDREGLKAAGEAAGLVVASYRRFLFGLNQLCVFERKAD